MLSIASIRIKGWASKGLLVLAVLFFTGISSHPTVGATQTIPKPVGKLRWGYYVTYDGKSFDSLKEHISDLDFLSPYWFRLDGKGNIISSGNPQIDDPKKGEVLALARAKGVQVLPMVKNSDTYDAFRPVLADGSVRSRTINGIVSLVASGGFEGVHIDFEGINAEDRPHLSAFMAQLASALRKEGKLITQAIAAKDAERTTGWAGAYDYATLGAANDLLVLMAYGYGTSRPQSTAPFPWVEGSVSYAASQIPPQKLLLGLPWYGYDWNLAKGGSPSFLRYPDALALAQRHSIPIGYDEGTQGPNFTYSSGGEPHEVWFEDRRSNEAKLNLVFKYGLAGAAGWRMGHEDPGIWDSFRARLAYQTWYLAEGSTARPYHTWLLLMNPNPSPAQVKVSFMKEDGSTVAQSYTLKPTSRFSIFANQIVPDAAFSTKIEADLPIIVERAMYFGYDGHVSPGVNAPSRKWYIPEGYTGSGTHTWLLLMNPNPSSAQVKATFMKEDGSTVVQSYAMKPTSRLNLFANEIIPNTSFSTLVESDQPIVAERASYFDGGKGGHGSLGSPYTSRRWYLAEGFTGHSSWLLLMNPNTNPVQATVTLLLEDKAPITRTIQLKATSKTTLNVNSILPPNTPFSTLVEGDQPIVTERASYWGENTSGHSSLGSSAPALNWYFAEGATAYPFHTFLLLTNPNAAAAKATVTFMREGGEPLSREYNLPPRSRTTIYANAVAPNVPLATAVASDRPILAERAMYFGNGGTSSAGIPR